MLLLQGFPSSSYDFRSVTDRLGNRSWLTLDFLGFGLSDKLHRHNYSLLGQATIPDRGPGRITDAALRLGNE